MTGCCAINCSNHSRNGFTFHRFPADPERRKKWLNNCRRKDWNPSQKDRLCSKHFEENQYEENRLDGKKRLRPFAVPTLFDVPNLPKLIMVERKSTYERIDPPNRVPAQVQLVPLSNDCHSELNLLPDQEQQNELQDLKIEVKNLKNQVHNLSKEVILLKKEIEQKNILLATIKKKTDEKYKEDVPKCCNILEKLTNHYITVRGFSIRNHESAKRKSSTVFSSQSMHKKTKLS